MKTIVNIWRALDAAWERMMCVLAPVIFLLIALSGTALGILGVVCCLHVYGKGRADWWECLWSVAGSMAFFLVGCLMLRESRSKFHLRRLKPEQLCEPARRQLSLPYTELEQRALAFDALGDDGGFADDDRSGFFWREEGYGELSVRRLGNEDWVAACVCWSVDPVLLSRTQRCELCRREGIEPPLGILHGEAEGLALCRGGTLTLYPQSLMPDFEQSYLSGLMGEKKAFDGYLNERRRMVEELNRIEEEAEQRFARKAE